MPKEKEDISEDEEDAEADPFADVRALLPE